MTYVSFCKILNIIWLRVNISTTMNKTNVTISSASYLNVCCFLSKYDILIMVIKTTHSVELSTRLPCSDRFFKTRLQVTWQLLYFALLLNPGIAAISPRWKWVDLVISTTIMFINNMECYFEIMYEIFHIRLLFTQLHKLHS